MFSDKILEKFSGSSPLFPLPDFVLFPLTGYTFRIFEERYIKMVEDVLKNENLICVTQIDPTVPLPAQMTRKSTPLEL